MKKLLWLVPVVLLGTGIWWLLSLKNAPVEVRYTYAKTGPLVDVLVTNGKVEPAEYASVRAERSGVLNKLLVERGQTVTAGAIIAEMDSAELRASLEAAQARVAQIRAEMSGLQAGGRASDLADIDGQLARLNLERKQVETELAVLQRLIDKKAATPQEAITLRDRIAQIDEQRSALESRRKVLYTKEDRSLYDARLAEAQSAVELARERIAQGVLRSPVSGVVYQVDPRNGSYLNPGDLVANIGTVNELTVKVFIDEPELGRVGIGMPAVITWDAMPQRKWEGRVERMPVQIAPMGARQVGEVVVKIENQDHTLPPGANINAAIRSREVSSGVLIPKECLRRDGGDQGVYVMEGDLAMWRPVRIGVTNVTHAQILEGVKSGDRVLLATDAALRNGQHVRAVNDDSSQ